MSIHDWLNDLKVGDKVFAGSRFSSRLLEIERLTKTQIILKGGHGKYRKFDGYQVGSGSVWNMSSLRQATPELIAEFKRAAIIDRLDSFKWKSLDTSLLETICGLLGEEK